MAQGLILPCSAAFSKNGFSHSTIIVKSPNGSINNYKLLTNAKDQDNLVVTEDFGLPGSIGIYEGSVLINGNGAIIDLQNENGIWVYSDDYSTATLDIRYSSIINGAYHALSYSGNATGNIMRGVTCVRGLCSMKSGKTTPI